MIYVLRLLHILGGAFWFGAFLFVARFLMPAVKAAGPGAGPVMAQLGKRIPQAMMGAAAVTILSGIWLLKIVSGGAPGFMGTGFGRTLGIGAASAILALTLGMIINVPASRRMAVVNEGIGKRGGAPTPAETAELQKIMARLGMGTIIAGTFLTIAAAAMAVARYVP